MTHKKMKDVVCDYIDALELDQQFALQDYAAHSENLKMVEEIEMAFEQDISDDYLDDYFISAIMVNGKMRQLSYLMRTDPVAAAEMYKNEMYMITESEINDRVNEEILTLRRW